MFYSSKRLRALEALKGLEDVSLAVFAPQIHLYCRHLPLKAHLGGSSLESPSWTLEKRCDAFFHDCILCSADHMHYTTSKFAKEQQTTYAHVEYLLSFFTLYCIMPL